MTAIYNLLSTTRIRLGQWLSLIFFVCLLVGSCRQKDEGITIVWNGNQATGIVIPKRVLGDDADSLFTVAQVRLKGNVATMLGNYKSVDGNVVFTPVIPFTAGADYEVLYKNNLIGTVNISAPNPANSAYVINVFPAVDTVPMNLLKIYVQFSAPMRQGEALQHIHLVNEQNDTMPKVFLDLQPELWDSAGKILTVWLDPGRIKRDLIPNQQLGNPLQPGKRYRIAIDTAWKDAQNLPLRQSFSKQFVAGARDSISPQPQQWKLELPVVNTHEGLGINFGESLDYFLAGETITIIDEKGNVITGTGGPLNNGTGYAFLPGNPWQPGTYKLRVVAILEDLAGNNLNRLFDRDLQMKTIEMRSDFVERTFVIKTKAEAAN